MEISQDEPLSYWVTVARMGFEDDLHRILGQVGISRAELAKRLGATPAYVSKVLNGSDANYTIETMAKWARALGSIAQIRLIVDGKEAVRVVDYETAGEIDDAIAGASRHQPAVTDVVASITDMGDFKRRKSAGAGANPGFSFSYRASNG